MNRTPTTTDVPISKSREAYGAWEHLLAGVVAFVLKGVTGVCVRLLRGLGRSHIYPFGSLAQHTVGQAMTTDVWTVPTSLPLSRLFEMFFSTGADAKHEAYPVTDDSGQLVGMVSRSDLPGYDLREALGWLVVADVMNSGAPLVAYPEESLRDAGERMIQVGVGQLPVVSPEKPGQVIGILSRSDVLKSLLLRVDEQNNWKTLVKRVVKNAA
jgi:CBS domain-containing protein